MQSGCLEAGSRDLSHLSQHQAWHLKCSGHNLKRCLRRGRGVASGQRTIFCSAYSLNTDSLKTAVRVETEKVAGNTRRLYAGVTIQCPVRFVWQALTDYDSLAKFIPGLTENKCLKRHPQGARLLQIGEQQIALGAKFRARVVLDIQEYPNGVPRQLCSSLNGSTGSLFNGRALDAYPQPRSLDRDGQPQDVAFSMVEGDFSAFKGIWRMQARSAEVTRLSYSLHVQPQRWLPVRLIQSRIEGEIAVNLNAVRVYTEQLSRL